MTGTAPLDVPAPDDVEEHGHFHPVRLPALTRAWHAVTTRGVRIKLKFPLVWLYDRFGPTDDPNTDGHEQVTVEVNDEAFDVDRRMVPLLRSLWAAGITTYTSCEGEPALVHATRWNQSLRYSYWARFCVDQTQLNAVGVWIDEVIARFDPQMEPPRYDNQLSEYWHVWFDPDLLERFHEEGFDPEEMGLAVAERIRGGEPGRTR